MTRQYRKQWFKWHLQYEKQATIVFQRAFKSIANDIPFDTMSTGTYQEVVMFHVSEGKIFDAYVDVYKTVGFVHGKRIGRQINQQINEKDFTLDGFISAFERNITRWLIENGGQRIVSVRQNYIKFINDIIARGLLEGKTIQQISKDMQRLIKSRNFYRWQSLRIARTETTTAANYAATVASSISGVIMDKVWISAQDNRTRQPPDSIYDHFDMNWVKVPLAKPFFVSGENLMYPGDPKGSSGNTINCRCTVAQVVRRDSNGRIIRV